MSASGANRTLVGDRNCAHSGHSKNIRAIRKADRGFRPWPRCPEFVDDLLAKIGKPESSAHAMDARRLKRTGQCSRPCQSTVLREYYTASKFKLVPSEMFILPYERRDPLIRGLL